MASPYPHNGVIADLAHAQGGLVGYVHPFDTLPDPAHDAVLSNELPADVINGKVDYIEVIGFSDHKATAQVWYRLLNLGFHLPTGSGTDAMANYASQRGPVGLNRVFLDTAGKRDAAAAMAALRAGRGFASNGPLLGLLLDEAKPGDTIAAGKHRYRVALRSPVAVQHLELVHNGKVVKTFEGHTHHVLGVSWKRDGRTLASAGADNVIKVWDFVTGERKKTIEGFGKEVTSISFIGITDQTLASSGDDQIRTVSDNGDKIRAFEGATNFMNSASVTPDGKIVIAGGYDGVLRVWNGINAEVMATFAPPRTK